MSRLRIPHCYQLRVCCLQVTGPPANVQRAEEALAAKVRDLELDKEDRLLKSHELKVEVKPDYHPKLIGTNILISYILTVMSSQTTIPN